MSGVFTRKVGEPLRLVANLKDSEEGLFVSALLWREDGTSIAGPFDLTEVSKGLHKFNGVALMPNVSQVFAKYIVYSDAQRTSIVDCYEQPVAVFELDSFDPALIQPIAAEIKAVVQDGSVIGRVESGASITGVVGGDEVIGKIEESAEVTGTIEQEQNIIGGVDE